MATIKPKRGSGAPSTGLTQYELAVDTTNKRIYIGNAGGSGDLIGSAPGGSDTQVQFNDGGALGGDAGLTYNKTTDALTMIGNLNVNGGTIRSSQATFNLLNSTVTTLNIGGASTSTTIGSTSGTITLNNPTLVGSQTTQYVYNTVATTINFAGAAATLTMGATSGTAYLRNPTLTLGNTTSTVVTNSGTTNHLTFSPYGNIKLFPVNSVIVGGSIPAITVENSDQAGGVVEIDGGNLYLGRKTADDTNYTPVQIVFEGSSADAYETTLTPQDPTADRTITLPDATGTIALVSGSDTQVMFNDGGALGGDAGLTYNKTTDTLTVGSLVSTSGISVNGVIVFTFEGITADDYETQMLVAEPTQDNFIYFPNSSGYVALVPGSDTQVMFNDGGTTLGGDSGFTYNKSTDTLTLGGDIAVNGGDLTTTAGTASVFNTNATTLNIGQAATQINLGASSGDVDIAGGLQTVDEIVAGTVLGVNKTDPQYAADINSSSGACLRLIYNSSSGTPTNYVLFAVSSSGDLTLTPSGGDVSVNANMGMNDKTLSRVELLDYFERHSSPSINPKNSTLTLDLSTAQVFTTNLDNAISTLTISNVPDNGNANAVGFTLILVADGTARTVTWPASVKWPGGTAPTLTSTNGKADVLSFVSTNAGTNWYGFVGGQNF